MYIIREEQLFKECDPEFETFRDFVEGALGMTRSWAHQQIDAFLVIANLVEHNKATGDNLPLPSSQRQCRELAKLDPETTAQVDV